MNIHQLLAGFGFLFDGMKLLRQVPGLLKWALIPFFISLVLLVTFLGWGFASLSGWVGAALGYIFASPEGALYTLLYYPLYLILAFGFTVMIIYGVFLISTVVASPFNGILAEKTLSHLGVIPKRRFEFKRWALISLRLLGTSILKALLFTFIGIFIFIFSYIPGLNLVASYAAVLVMAFDSTDYSYEVLEMTLGERLNDCRANLGEFSGMAGALGLTLLLPGLTLLLLPVSVVGAASRFVKRRVNFDSRLNS